MKSKSYSELILGDALETILAEQENYMPVISEYQFQKEVLDLLENLFELENLQRYSLYVGELTKPLNVVADTDRDQVLFTVPAVVQSPIPTIPAGNMMVENFLWSLRRDIDLGGHHVDKKIYDYMMQITKVPDYLEQVIRPIQAILARYGRTMVPLPGLDSPSSQSSVSATGTSETHSSFSDEYED